MSTLSSRFTRVFGAELAAQIIARIVSKKESPLAACDAAVCSHFDGVNHLALADRFNLPVWAIRAAVERHRASIAHRTGAPSVWPVLAA